MTWAICLLIAVVPGLAPHGPPPLSEEAPITRITGNDRVTVGIDRRGNLAQLRWPTRGFSDHLNYDFGEIPAGAGGARWVFLEDGVLGQFHADTWQVTHRAGSRGELISKFEERDGDRSAVQRVYVASDFDMVMVALDLEGFSPTVRCFWNQHLSPSFGPVPGVPGAYGDFQRVQGFGTFYEPDDDMVVQFRPREAGQVEWERVRRLARDHASSAAWAAFGEGAYWGTFSPYGTVQRYCAPASASIDSILKEEPYPAARGVAGRGQVIIEPTLHGVGNNRSRVVVCMAVASSHGALRQLRRTVHGEDLPPAAVFPPVAQDAEGEAIGALLACVDGYSGSVLRAPVSYPPIAYATVFDSAWASAALDEVGLAAVATRALDFHLAGARQKNPMGATPAAIFSSGEVVSFFDGVNPVTSAWLLAAIWRHSATLPPEAARRYLEERRPDIEACARFLASASVVGGVLSGALKPEAASVATLQTHYLGLLSARALVEQLGGDEPAPWRNRREEVYARIRFRQLGGTENAAPALESQWLAYWVEQLPEAARVDGPLWQVLESGAAVDGASLLSGSALDLNQPAVSPHVPMAIRAALQILEGAPGTESAR